MRTRAGVLAVALLLASAPMAVAGTRGQRVEPFAAAGAVARGWTVAAGTSGSCFTTSIATRRADAYRCFSGANEIVDPCFSSPDVRDAVLCVPYPWRRRAIRVHLTKALPAAGRGGSTVWGVELANGGRCEVSTGANAISHGRIVGWYCTDGALAQRLHPATTWWAWWQPKGGGAWHRVAIDTVFR